MTIRQIMNIPSIFIARFVLMKSFKLMLSHFRVFITSLQKLFIFFPRLVYNIHCTLISLIKINQLVRFLSSFNGEIFINQRFHK